MKKLLFCAAAACVLCGPAFAADPVIDPARITGHVKVLASDAFEGRGPATEGETKTIGYVAEQFKAAGLQPGGDLLEGGKGARAWTQDVPLARFKTKGPVSVSVTAGGKTEA